MISLMHMCRDLQSSLDLSVTKYVCSGKEGALRWDGRGCRRRCSSSDEDRFCGGVAIFRLHKVGAREAGTVGRLGSTNNRFSREGSGWWILDGLRSRYFFLPQTAPLRSWHEWGTWRRNRNTTVAAVGGDDFGGESLSSFEGLDCHSQSVCVVCRGKASLLWSSIRHHRRAPRTVSERSNSENRRNDDTMTAVSSQGSCLGGCWTKLRRARIGRQGLISESRYPGKVRRRYGGC